MNDDAAACWVPVPGGSDFTPANLPFGVAETPGWAGSHVVVAIGEQAFDCHAAHVAGLLRGLDADDDELLMAPSLNGLLAGGRRRLGELRRRVAEVLVDPGGPPAVGVLRPLADLTMRCPVEVGDYVDFYSSEHHARNLGRILRPGEDPLAANWKVIPVGYHGRSGSVTVGGDVVRPLGMIEGGDGPSYAPTRQLDIELEIGAVVGAPSRPGRPVAVTDAEEHVAGLVLMNDWSARDIQAFEYRPLGPNLGKSFATTVSPWMVTLDALEPFRVDGPEQDPSPPPHLATMPGRGFAIDLEVLLRTPAMRERGLAPVRIAGTTFAHMYWGVAQQLAHLTGNGAAVRTGDLLGSGTVSAPGPAECGSLIELTERGSRPIDLPGHERRGFLEDGDEVTLRAWAGTGATRVGFGLVRDTVRPAFSADTTAHRPADATSLVAATAAG